MALRYRKRSKGKNSWLNTSWSEKNGLGFSWSIKPFKNTTINLLGRNGPRVTFNLPGGLYYVVNGKKSKQKDPKTKTRTNHSSSKVHSDYYKIDTDAYMERFYAGRTEQEYNDWYNLLDEVEKFAEDNRVDEILKDLAKDRARLSARMKRQQKSVVNEEEKSNYALDAIIYILYLIGILIINPFAWLVGIIIYVSIFVY